MNKGFTLMELLVVLGVLCVLAIAIVATINPFEQIKKAQDQDIKNVAVESVNANVRYYETHGVTPWAANVNCLNEIGTGNVLSNTPSCLSQLISDGELKASFTTATGILDKIYVSACGDSVTLCFNPQSKSQNQDENTKYDKFGNIKAGCPSSNGDSADCYWCTAPSECGGGNTGTNTTGNGGGGNNNNGNGNGNGNGNSGGGSPTPTPTTTPPSQAFCTNSAEGDYYTKGTSYNSIGDYFTDYCLDNVKLYKGSCNPDDTITRTLYSCPYGCSNGACLKAYAGCTDSDGGINYDVKGTATNYFGDYFTDYCGDNTQPQTLYEGSCNANNTITRTSYTCPYGCSNGACLKAYAGCTSPEGGDYYTKGTSNNYWGDFFTDYCINSTQMYKGSCLADNLIIRNLYTCPNGCSNGACIK